MATTPISSLRYPASSDPPDGPTGVHNLASDIDSITVPKFASTAARDAAIPSPVAGAVCALTATGSGGLAMQHYRSGQWQSMSEMPYFIRSVTDTTVTSSTTFTNSQLVAAIVANWTYQFVFKVFLTAGTGLTKFAITHPVTASNVCVSATGLDTSVTGSGGAGTIGSMKTQSYASVTSGSSIINFGGDSTIASLVTFEGTLVANTSGSVALQFAQNASNATPSTVKTGSWAKFTRVG